MPDTLHAMQQTTFGTLTKNVFSYYYEHKSVWRHEIFTFLTVNLSQDKLFCVHRELWEDKL